jgi:hypothetical protein
MRLIQLEKLSRVLVEVDEGGVMVVVEYQNAVCVVLRADFKARYEFQAV